MLFVFCIETLCVLESDTSDGIVKCGSSLFSDTIKCQPNPSELFHNINIYGAHIDVNCVSTTTGTLTVHHNFFLW